jgi:CO/xanthine dehydrogenase Mo-binding subunit
VRELRERVLDWWGRAQGGHGAGWREIARRCFATNGDMELTVRHEPPEWQVFDEATYRGVAYATFGWGADVIEVEVDPDTLEVRPVAATVVCEVGRVIHDTLCRGQIEGGTLQGIAYAYLEEMKMKDGRYLNDRLSTYIIPTVKDTPRMEVHLLERPWEGGAFGAKGVGELPVDGAAPAVVAAIENATGIAPDEIPATPERLLEWEGRGQRVP